MVIVEAREALGRLRYRHPFRKYQMLALEELDRRRAAPEPLRRFHVVAPPGSGKTVLGLEIARRVGRPTLVLCPNTAIREQWLRESADFANGEPLDFASDDPTRLAPLTVLTYQSLCNLADPDSLLGDAAREAWRRELRSAHRLSEEEVAAEEGRLRRDRPATFAREVAAHAAKLKREVARGEDGRLLGLLHENARQLVASLRAAGFGTIVLDECHHLCSTWGYVVRDVVRALGPDTLVVGLTSTPPADLSGDERDLYLGLLGEPSFQVPTPAVVRERHLAPYQELAYFVTPLPSELEFVADRHRLFADLIDKVADPGFASRSLTEWVIERVRLRESGPTASVGEGGARLSFGRFARTHPTLARAAIRFLHSGAQPLPPEVHLNELLRQPPDVDDWVALLEDYCLRCLRPSPNDADARALEEVRRALLGLGYVLTRAGIRAYVSPVDRVLALSAAKELATAEILATEASALGAGLRALVVCDYEALGTPLEGDLAAILDPQSGSALRVLARLAADDRTATLSPVLVTGSGVWADALTAERIGTRVAEMAGLPAPLGSVPERRVPGDGLASRILRLCLPSGWGTDDYLPAVTRLFHAGETRCLVGTRGLLGEGWDAPRANTLVDLTTATTQTSMHQLRGRTLRLDPAWPEKVADNWDVVCVSDLPKGGADYGRFVRKHRAYFGLGAAGAVESGVGHVHPDLSPFGPPSADDLRRLNADLLRKAADRESARLAWQVGAAYENAIVPTIRVRASRPLGVVARRVRVAVGRPVPERDGARAAGAAVAGWVLASAALLFGAPEVAALASGCAVTLGAGISFARTLGRSFGAIPGDLALDGCARAVLAALRDAGAVSEAVDESHLELVPGPDGYYRCYLSDAPEEASQLFAECLEDVLAPFENQRYVVPRYWAEAPTSGLGQALFVGRSLLGGRGLYRVQYHPVPDYFAVNRKRVDVFVRQWNRYVSPGEAVYAYGKRGEALLVTERGRNAFGLLCQLRTIWR